MKTTLVIMAAGLGSRFGGGIKQLAPVGPGGEIIMDYSIHDAIEAGFEKIIFIIRRDIEADFRAMLGERIEAVCAKLGVDVAYAYQSMDDIPAGHALPAERTKPLGTGHAVLAARGLIDSPFAVINADDYYGKRAYRLLHDFLAANTEPTAYAMAGFILKNTLSENGGVTRGICRTGGDMLLDVVETKNIVPTAAGAAAGDVPLDINVHVSMNMWALMPEFVPALEKGFGEFLAGMTDPMKDEYLLPVFIGDMLKKGRITVKMLETEDQWFGVTYKEDQPGVVASIRALVDSGVYASDLYSDLTGRPK